MGQCHGGSHSVITSACLHRLTLLCITYLPTLSVLVYSCPSQCLNGISMKTYFLLKDFEYHSYNPSLNALDQFSLWKNTRLCARASLTWMPSTGRKKIMQTLCGANIQAWGYCLGVSKVKTSQMSILHATTCHKFRSCVGKLIDNVFLQLFPLKVSSAMYIHRLTFTFWLSFSTMDVYVHRTTW